MRTINISKYHNGTQGVDGTHKLGTTLIFIEPEKNCKHYNECKKLSAKNQIIYNECHSNLFSFCSVTLQLLFSVCYDHSRIAAIEPFKNLKPLAVPLIEKNLTEIP